MSKYEEICDASKHAVKRWNEYRDRSWGYLNAIVQGLVTYCGVPRDKITFLRSNGLPGEERRYRPAEDEGLYSLPGAVTFDEQDEYWHLGVAITLSRPGVFPERWIGGVLCGTEDDGQAVVKIGANGKPRVIDFSDPNQCANICDEFSEFLKGSFDNPRKITKQIGFSTVANPQQGEKQEKTPA
jgi:hypothetical protein